ncbi:hypothetical protein DFH09DRAFT_1153618, partial [Mycena vulgaris]
MYIPAAALPLPTTLIPVCVPAPTPLTSPPMSLIFLSSLVAAYHPVDTPHCTVSVWYCTLNARVLGSRRLVLCLD